MRKRAYFRPCIAIFLLLAIIFLLPCQAYADTQTYLDYTYQLNEDGDAILVKHLGEDTYIKIPAGLDGHKVVEIGQSAFHGQNITYVHLPIHIKKIGVAAFSGCRKLKQISFDMPTVTHIGNAAFQDTALDFLYLCPGIEVLGSGILSGNEGVASLFIPKSVTEMDGTLGGSAVKQVIFADGTVTIPVNALSSGKNVESVHLLDSVTEIQSQVFLNTPNLKAIQLPQNLKQIGSYGFRQSGITTLSIPASVTEMSQALQYSLVKTLTFEDGLKTIPFGALRGAESIKNLCIPDSVTEIEGHAFESTKLGTITLPPNLEKIDSLAFNQSDISTLSIPASVTYMVEALEGSSVEMLTFANGMKHIPRSACENAAKLKTVHIPNSVTSIGGWAFANCDTSETITIPNSVTNIENCAFEDCDNLNSITLPEGVEFVASGTFSNCKNLTSVTVLSADTRFIDIDCDTNDCVFTGSPNVTIYGIAGSRVEEYAKKHSIPFVSIGSDDTDPTDPTKPTDPTDPTDPTPPSETIPMYRLYNQYTNEHLFLTSAKERTMLIAGGWTDDGIGWYAATSGNPVYRLYNPFDDFHFYTKSMDEANHLLTLGWKMDGPVSYNAGKNGIPIYRLFNPYESKNYHHYTTDLNEANFLTSLGWKLEGVAWYAVK